MRRKNGIGTLQGQSIQKGGSDISHVQKYTANSFSRTKK